MADILSKQAIERIASAVAPMDPGEARSERIRRKVLEKVRGEPVPQGLFTVAESDGSWKEASPGNWIKLLRSDGKTMSALVRLEAGAVFPEHSHATDEETFVLEGEARFGDIELKAGDYHLAARGTEHGQVSTTTGCLLFLRTGLSSASSDGE